MLLLLNNHLYRAGKAGKGFLLEEFGQNLSQYNDSDSSDYLYLFCTTWLWTQNLRTGKIYALNVNTGIRKTVPVESTYPIYNVWGSDKRLYMTIDRYTYIFNQGMEMIRKIAPYELAGHEKSNYISYLVEDSLWKAVYSTSDGLFIDYGSKAFEKYTSDLSSFKYVGCAADSGQYWWNKPNRILARIQPTGKIIYLHFPQISNARKILPFDNKNILIFSDNGIFRVDNAGRCLLNYFKGISKCSRRFINGEMREVKYSFSQVGLVSDAVVNKAGDIYVVSKGSGLCRININADSLSIAELNSNKLRAVTPDTVHKLNWFYNESKIFAYDHSGKEIYFIGRNFLDRIGIRKIEKIAIDGKGNIFLKDHEKLFLFDPVHEKYYGLLNNYNLQNAVFNIYGNKLVAAGRFGILFCRVNGHGLISKPVAYENIRNINYSSVYDMQVSGNGILLNTDNGTYRVNMPGENVYKTLGNIMQHPYNFLVTYKDSTKKISTGDTISIDQKNPAIQFDIVNPYGNGIPKYKYRFENHGSATWNDLGNNNLHLSALQPGAYYRLSVIASDDVWKSESIGMYIYIVPYWWQTVNGQRKIAVAAAILALLFISILVYITNKIAAKRHLKKNRLLSLELKSIYAQINPHFIFNSLNTGLYFIKEKRTTEAYEHISSFSELLRSYIRSARNKSITIAEEMENLTNYISLQQSRFENKFNSRISVDESLDIEHTRIPSLLLQPLVENAIVHGLLNSEEPGRLEIEFIKGPHPGELVCIIDDNGIGREQSKIINGRNPEKIHSYGTDLIKDLINLFNTYKHAKIEIDYIDKQKPLTGTKVIVVIKNLDDA